MSEVHEDERSRYVTLLQQIKDTEHYDVGDRMTDRYTTQEAAEAGHERVVEQLRAGEYRFEPTGRRLVLEDTDGD